VVEDDPSLQFFYKQLLTLNGFELAEIAKNGEEAVSMFKSFSEKPKVILMDHRMPIKNGIEASKEILQIDNSVKIIFTSADSSIKEEAHSIGAFSSEDKPFTIEHIINVIKKALG
jgi:two-component system chemotaxis response regulator CheY